MLTVYTYAKCSTCVRALRWLDAKGIEHRVVPIREQPPTLAELKRMLAHQDGTLKSLFNRSGQDYRALNLKDRLAAMSEAQALALLAANGNLVKRPFVIGAKVGLVGFAADAWSAALT